MDIIGVARCGRIERNESTCGSAVVSVGVATSSPKYSDQIPLSLITLITFILYDRLLFLSTVFLNGCTWTGLFCADTRQPVTCGYIQNTSRKRRISAMLIERIPVIDMQLLWDHESVCRAKLNLLSIDF